VKEKAVVTLCLGHTYDLMADYTHPTIKNYADKLDADFIVINTIQTDTGNPGYEKFQLYGLLNHYKRVIFLDSDILIRSNCPDLFKVVPEEDFGAFVESNYILYNPDVDHRERMSAIQEENGYIGWNYEYFNSGVMVISKKHQEAFNLDHGTVIDLHDQTQLNYNVKKLGFWVHDIGLRFNNMDFVNPLTRLEAYIIHYAGRGYTDEYHNMRKKIERIKQDVELLKNV
jgi:lipopolysaccharide biosynthesis glycosyltransferase